RKRQTYVTAAIPLKAKQCAILKRLSSNSLWNDTDGQRLALRGLSTANCSSFAPAFSLSRNHRGCAPRPAHVLPDLSRYLIATLRPASGLLPAFLLVAPSLESSVLN